MKKIFPFFFFLILFLSSISPRCSDEQININTASSEDLDKITYVGPATATKIINARPFDSLDDLINVSGIGETKLKAIKEEGLACVENSKTEKNKEEENLPESEKNEEKTEKEVITNYSLSESPLQINEIKTIKLNSKDIKNNNSIQENKEGISTEKYAGFGLFALCLLVLILLFLGKKKNGLQ